MMKIVIFIAFILTFIGCGAGSSEDEVNLFKAKNALGFYGGVVLFDDKLVTGVWAQYEYENNSTTTLKADPAFKHKFDEAGVRYIQVPLLGETWYPIGKYGVNNQGTRIIFNEGNNTTGYYEYFSNYDASCVEIGQFKDVEHNLTLSDTYVFCKEY